MLTGCSPFILQLWKGNKLKAPVLEAKILFFSIGYVLAPIIFIGLLADVKLQVSCDYANVSAILAANDSYLQMNVSNFSSDASTTVQDILRNNVTISCFAASPEVSLAKWSFVISGALFTIPCGLFAIASVSSQTTRLYENDKKKVVTNDSATNKNKSDKTFGKIFTITFVSSVIMLIFANGASLGTLLQHLQTFATQYIGWKVKKAAILNSIVGISIVAGRIFATLMSAFFQAEFLIAYSLILSLSGITLSFAASRNYLSTLAMWFGSFLTGFGLAPIIPCSFLWTNLITGLSTVQSAVITAGMFAGFGLGPMMTSVLINISGYMAMIYVLFAMCSFKIIIHATLHYLGKYIRKLNGECNVDAS